jgi:hypothetical protein
MVWAQWWLFPQQRLWRATRIPLGLEVHARSPDVTCISRRNLVRRIFCYIFFKGVTMRCCLIVNRKIFAFEINHSRVRRIRRESMTRDIFFFLPWKSSLTSLEK